MMLKTASVAHLRRWTKLEMACAISSHRAPCSWTTAAVFRVMRSLVTGLLIAATVLLSGCYRLANPPELGDAVRIEVVGNQGRMPRAQGYVVDAVSNALITRLGWRVRPNGTTRLQLSLHEEGIDAPGQDRQGISNSWSIRLSGTALLVARGGSITSTFSGLGNATGLNSAQGGEAQALQSAAKAAADDLVSWLDANAGGAL